MKELPEYQRNHDIDLVDILAVLIKRKWIIIGFVLIAFIFTGLNVIKKKGNGELNYSFSVIITLPQTFSIESNNFLALETSRVDILLSSDPSRVDILLSSDTSRAGIILNAIRDELNLKSYKIINNVFEYYYNYEVTLQEDQLGQPLIKITIEGDKQKIIQAISYLYLIYINFDNEINEKNQIYFQSAQNTLQRNIERKKELLDKYISILDQKELKNDPLSTTIINQIPTLISEISIFERTLELNKSTKLLNSKFILLKNLREIIINKDNIANIDHYIMIEKDPAPSKKRQILFIVISVFLAFLVGIFFAFVVEFFNREDIKKRLKEINEK